MRKVLPLRSWAVLPTVTLLVATSAQSAMAGHNNQPGGWARSNQFRAHSLNISAGASADARSPKWSSFESATGVTRNISRRVDFDLSSTRANITLGSRLFQSQSSVTIDIGGTLKTLSANSKVTAAEYVAALQQLDGGGQSLVLGKDGQGVGGTFTLDSIDNAGRSIKASELVIPQGVTGVGNFGRTSDFRVVGNLVNDGNVYALSNNPSNSLATISAKNVINESNGVISSAVPTSVSSAYGSTLSEVDLRLRADNDITNKGSIISSGNLDLIAGGSLTNTQGAAASAANNLNINVGSGTVTNGGTITSTTGNINFASSVSAQDLNVLNGGGTLQALNGDINFRDPSYADVGNINVFGGNLYSKQVNLNSGTGTADVGVENITGLVNVNAACTHVTATSGDLNLGTMNLTGDPTYYSVTGDVSLSSSISTNGANLAIIAGGDVIMTAGGINTSSVGGNSGNILIVAGAFVTAPASGSANNDTTTTVSIANSANAGKGSLIGGKIDLGAGAGVTSGGVGAGSNGGDITMVAYAGTAKGSGSIALNTGTLLNSNGIGGTNGNITLIAGGLSGTTINAGNIQTSGSSQTGNIFISTSTPTITGSGTITVLNGTVQPGSGTFSNGALQKSASAAFATLLVNNSSVTWHNGGTIFTPVISGTTKSVDFETGGDLNIITSIAASGGITLKADGSVRSNTSPIGISSASSTGNAGAIVISAGTATTFGEVDFSTSPISVLDSHSSALNGSGGDIQITSTNFGGSGGRVIIPNSVTILSGGSGSGNNGNVSITASSSGDQSTAISLGGIDTTGGATNGTGSIVLNTPNGGMTVNGLISTDSANVTASGFGNVLFNNQISGNGSAAFSAAAGGVLQLDQITANRIIGTSQNLTGNGILLNGNLTAPGGILLVSKIDIETSIPNHLISTASSAGDGGNLIMIAGANFLQDASKITIQGASLPGGQIDMSTVQLSGIDTHSTATGGSGGSVVLVGYTGNTGQGQVLISQTAQILTGGSGAGSNGDVTVVSGTNNTSTGIQVGNIDVSGNINGNGVIILQTAVPKGSVANPILISTSTITPSATFEGSNILTAGDISAKFLTSPSGTVDVQSGRQVQLGSVNVSAATTTANGGLISVTSNSSNVLNIGAGTNSITALTADGGSTSGNGGGYILRNNGSGGINATAISVPFVTSGNGGSITLDATSGTLTLPSVLAVNGKGSGGGGNLSVAGNVISPTSLTLAANGVNGGSGGSIFVNQSGSATTIVDGTHIQLFATGASGGEITVQSGGDLSVNVNSLKVSPLDINGKGGSIFLDGKKVVNALGGTLVLDVSAQTGGTGSGGTVSVNESNALGPVNVSSGGDFQLIANSGTLGGDGGTAVLLSNTNLIVKQSGVRVDPLGKNGNGGTIAMNAGVSGTGNLLVDGNLSALGKGTGNGGTIVLQSTSASLFTLKTDSKPVNGVFGTLSTLSKKGISGVISIINSNSGISILEPLLNQDTLSLIAGGTISTNSSLGGKKITNFMNITTTGAFTSVNPKVVLTALDAISFNVGGTTGAANVPITFNSGKLTFNGNGAAFLVNKAKTPLLINSSTAGADFNLTTASIENGNTSATGVALTDTVGKVTLNLTKGGIGANGSFLTKVTDLSFNSKRGLIDITNSSVGALALEDSNAGGIINISSSSDISIVGSVGTTKANVSLLATNAAKIVNGGGTVNGATVSLTSFNGSVGDVGNGAVLTNASTLVASAGTTINLVDSADSVVLGNLTSNNGDLTVKTAANTKALNVQKNAIINAVNGKIVLQQSNTTKGKIAVGANSVIQTTGLTGDDVYIYIGSALPAKVNPITTGDISNVVVDNQNVVMGQVFAGNNGFTAKAPTNTLTTKGRDIVIDTGTLSAKNIVLGGGVQITADPPLPEGMATASQEMRSAYGSWERLYPRAFVR